MQLDEGELDRLVRGQRLAEGGAHLGVLDRLIDAELRRTEARRRLTDAVLVEEVLHDLQTTPFATEDRAVRHPHVGQTDVGMVGGHVERPQELDDLEPGTARRHEEGRDAFAVTRLAAGAGHDHVVLRAMDAGVPGLLTVDDPLVAVAHRVGLHVGRVGTVRRLGDAEREAAASLGEVVDPLGLLVLGAVEDHQQQTDVVADDGVLVLQVAVQAEPLAGEVLADHRHAEVGAVLTAVLLREGIAVVAGRVGETARLVQQRLPFLVRETTALPVRAGVLATVIEEPDVVVLLLERLDLALDELIQFNQVIGQVLVEFEVHGVGS